MDTCDRYALHEMYKDKMKQIIKRFSYDLISALHSDTPIRQIETLEMFCEQWVDDNVRPTKFEEHKE